MLEFLDNRGVRLRSERRGAGPRNVLFPARLDQRAPDVVRRGKSFGAGRVHAASAGFPRLRIAAFQRAPMAAPIAPEPPLVPSARLKRDVVQAIAGCLFVTLRNAGHNLPVEAPGEIAGVVSRFSA